jgi:predicted nucleic acid-binding protein
LVDAKADFRTIIKAFRSIGLDTQLFIYHFQENTTYLPLTQAIFETIESGQVKASTSVVTLLEILVKPKREGNARAVEEYKFALQTFPNLKLKSVDQAVAEKAAEIRATHNLRPPDAIQLASAITENAEAFITNDDRLKRAAKEIHVIVLREYRSIGKPHARSCKEAKLRLSGSG